MKTYISTLLTPTLHTPSLLGILITFCWVALILLTFAFVESPRPTTSEFLAVLFYLTALFYFYSSIFGILVKLLIADVVLKGDSSFFYFLITYVGDEHLVILLSIILTLLTSARIIKLYEYFRDNYFK